MNDSSEDLILIQGAGIAGLTLALALTQKNLRVAVVEKSAALAETGAGIWMAPNAMQVFRRLGIADAISKAGWPIQKLSLEDYSGKELQQTDMALVASEFGEETVAIHRARLHKILYDSIPTGTVTFGAEIEKVLDREAGIVQLNGGRTLACKAVIGADGINSDLARLTGFEVKKRYSGSSSYRGISRGCTALPNEEHASRETWGPGCRLGFSKISVDEFYWYLTFDQAAGMRRSPSDAYAHAEEMFKRYFPKWKSLIEGVEPRSMLQTDIYDISPMNEWSKGRVLLIGDAAHATTPNMGQGGAMAVEDAHVLSSIFKFDSETRSIFDTFQKVRRPKVDWTVNTSRRVGQICHLSNPLAVMLRNLFSRALPRSAAQAQLRRIYALTGGTIRGQ